MMNRPTLLVFLLLILLHVLPSWTAKDRNEVARIPDQDKTLEDWLLVRKKALDLRINTLHLLYTSSHRAAAESLYRHYHPNNPVQQPNPSEPDFHANTNQLPPPPPPPIESIFTFSPPTIPVPIMTNSTHNSLAIDTATQSAKSNSGGTRRRTTFRSYNHVPPVEQIPLMIHAIILLYYHHHRHYLPEIPLEEPEEGHRQL